MDDTRHGSDHEPTSTDLDGRPVLLLVEDDPPTLQVLSILLAREGFDVIGAARYSQALSAIEEQAIDGALADQHLPEGSGLALLEELKARRPLAARALMTGEVIGDLVNQAGELDAQPYRKPFPIASLGAFLEKARRSFRRRSSPIDRLSPATPFTPRERECLARALAHRRRRAIAEDLGISAATVKTHIRRALDKLDLGSVEEARALARARLDEP